MRLATKEGILLGRCAIPRDMVSYNRSQNQHWSNKLKSSAQKKDWMMWLRSDEGLGIPENQTIYRRKLIITRIVSGPMKKFEKVNYYAGAKPIEDAMVMLGWLKDDDEKHCELIVEQKLATESDDWVKDAVQKIGAKIAVEVYELGTLCE